MGRIRDAWRVLVGRTSLAALAVAQLDREPSDRRAANPAPMRVSDVALAEATAAYGRALDPWTVPPPPPFVPEAAKLAMDRVPAGGSSMAQVYQWAASGAFSEGLGFLGYPYLAELSQRPEYRHVAGVYADEATRKWIKWKGPETVTAAIEKQFLAWGVRDACKRAIELDGFFGRAHFFIDLGDDPTDPDLATPFTPEARVSRGSQAVKGIRVIEPFWCYPGQYESTNPLSGSFYQPQHWFVMASTVHESRLITIVGREVPDILKATYQFGGLSLSQMVKPYVDNWLRARQSVSDLLHSFSTMVLKTDLATVLAGGSSAGLIRRLELFNRTRDNRGVMALNKDTEELENVSTPLGTIDKLQAQAQEQIASISGIPLVVLLGVTPSGLNASSDGEIAVWHARVRSYQEKVLREVITRLAVLAQLEAFGTVNPDVTFDFESLFEMSEKEAAEIRTADATTDNTYVQAGVVSNQEVRERITKDEKSPYFGMALSGDDERGEEEEEEDEAAAPGEEEDPGDPEDPTGER